jgi:hypothetical protein
MSHRHLVGMLRPGDRNDARDPLSATANRRRPLPGQSGWTPALDRTSGTSSRLCLSACERQPTTNTTRRAGGAAQAKQYPDDRATTACAGEGEDDRRRRRRPAPAHRRRVRNQRAEPRCTALTALQVSRPIGRLASGCARTRTAPFRQSNTLTAPRQFAPSGLPASALTGARHCWFLPAMRKTRVSDGEKPLRVETRFGSRALLQAAARGDLLSAELRSADDAHDEPLTKSDRVRKPIHRRTCDGADADARNRRDAHSQLGRSLNFALSHGYANTTRWCAPARGCPQVTAPKTPSPGGKAGLLWPRAGGVANGRRRCCLPTEPASIVSEAAESLFG